MRNLYSDIEVYYHMYKAQVPDGYIIGLVRDPYNENNHVAHLYKGTVDDPGDPMCKRGWNREKYGYSIWRNVVGHKGICKICLRRANKNLNPISFPDEWLEDKDHEDDYED